MTYILIIVNLYMVVFKLIHLLAGKSQFYSMLLFKRPSTFNSTNYQFYLYEDTKSEPTGYKVKMTDSGDF